MKRNEMMAQIWGDTCFLVAGVKVLWYLGGEDKAAVRWRDDRSSGMFMLHRRVSKVVKESKTVPEMFAALRKDKEIRLFTTRAAFQRHTMRVMVAKRSKVL